MGGEGGQLEFTFIARECITSALVSCNERVYVFSWSSVFYVH